MRRTWWALASALLVAMPFLVVEIPPCTDLPQHVAQIRLLYEKLGAPASPYELHWLTPYSLVYAPIAALWQIADPITTGRAVLLMLAVAIALGLHLVAARRDRPPEAAFLASVFVFSHPLYWGFLSFLLGIPLFFCWLLLLERPRRPARLEVALFFGAALLLDFTHALWLACGLLSLALQTLRRGFRASWPRWVGVAPVLALAFWQLDQLQNPRFPMAPLWSEGPLGRLAHITDAALGGLRSPLEEVVLIAIGLWITLGLASHRGRLRAVIDRELVAAGLLGVVGFLVLPDRYLNTVAFAQRWLPVALMFILLAVPAPPRPRLRQLGVALLATAWFVVTAASWRGYEEVELDDLASALAALPEKPRLLGLDLLGSSAFFKHRPGMQMFAWGQALRGGTVGFSFAEHSASLVAWPAGFVPPWTPGLEWHPERLEPRDLTYFDFLLVNGDAHLHAIIAALPGVKQMTDGAKWRLYRVASKE